jgi:hypothetical protein
METTRPSHVVNYNKYQYLSGDLMEERKDYNLCLVGDDVRYEVLSVPKNIPSVLVIRLSKSEREELLNHIYVIEIGEESKSYPTSLFTFDQEKKITVAAPSTSEVGSKFISPGHKYMTNGVTSSNPNGVRTVGQKGDFFQPSIPGCNYRSYLTGEHVDLVALEAVGGISAKIAPNNHHKTHPDYYTPGTTTTRCVEMDWRQYNSKINSSRNINQNSQMLSQHAAGTLSAAGGIIGGLAKKASFRVIYLSDYLVDVVDAIISWHNSKPTNPVTGQKNPTIVIGEWQYMTGNSDYVLIEDISSFTIRGTTTNRPGSDRNLDLNGWKLSDFVDNNMLPLRVELEVPPPPGFAGIKPKVPKWCIPFDRIGFDVSNRNIIQNMISNGIHFICAAGNDCGVYSKYNSSDWDNVITEEIISPGEGTFYRDHYVHRTISPGAYTSDQITVGARQRSEVTPAVDPYTARGPAIDIFGLGGGTWSSYPLSQYNDGYYYGIYSGTSAATPNVVGVAACILEYQYLTTGSYPNPATLKNLLLGAAKSNGVQNYESTDWDVDPSPDPKLNYGSPYLIDNNVNLLLYEDTNEAAQLRDASSTTISATDLVGASPRAAFLPDFMRTYNPDTGSSQADPVPPADIPGACVHPTIKGPTGLIPSPPYNYAQVFDKYEGNRGSLGGIYFQPQGEESNYPPENISYVAYRLRFRGFGPRGGSSSSDGETIYLTYNRGNLDPNKGTVRKWYTQNQVQVDNEPDKYTTSKSEAFVPFRIHFRVGFVCEGTGSYRILYSDHYYEWSTFEYKDIDFDSQELARQNNLPRDGDKLIFPDFSTDNYIKPRIFEIKSDIYNLDLNNLNEAKNRINMFAEAIRDDTKARESNFLEFGKYIIT